MKTRKHPQITYHILLALFLIGSVLGFIMEGCWSAYRVGHWVNHSATVWGPFCTVYGCGAVAMYLLACWLEKKPIWQQALAFSVAGGLVEYLSSLLQELVFGSTSWNYSKHFLNIGGRVSLKMTLVWGLLGLVFLRLLYPLLCRLGTKLHGKRIAVISVLLTAFMAINGVVSAAAILRWQDRQTNAAPSNRIEQLLDQHYDDARMTAIYSNMKFK